MSNDSLQTVYTWSLNLNNMISLSLMKDNEAKYNKYFVFFNCVPSSKKEDGSRTYDFKSGINYKLQPIKLFEIYTAICAYIKGQGRMIGQYGIINDTSKSSYGSSEGNNIKSLYFNYAAAEEKNHNIPGITVVSKFGEKKMGTYIPAPTALAFAEMCKKFFDETIKLDMSEFSSPSPSYQKRGDDFGGSEQHESKPSKKQQSVGGSESFPSFSDEEAPF